MFPYILTVIFYINCGKTDSTPEPKTDRKRSKMQTNLAPE